MKIGTFFWRLLEGLGGAASQINTSPIVDLPGQTDLTTTGQVVTELPGTGLRIGTNGQLSVGPVIANFDPQPTPFANNSFAQPGTPFDPFA